MAGPPRAEIDDVALRDEARLVAGLAANDARWVERFVRGAHRAVYALAVRLTTDPQRREEWTHETFVRLLADVREGRFVLRHPGGFWSWFRTRAYFLTLDQCRHVQREARRHDPDADLERVPDLGAFGAADPAREFERVALADDVERCLGAIANADHQRALRLLLLAEMHYDEVAFAMAAPLTTVKSWIRRGRIALRECLGRRWGLVAGAATSRPADHVFPPGDRHGR